MQEMWETWVRSLGRGDPLEKSMATHSSTLAWRILWTEEPGGWQFMGAAKNLIQLKGLNIHARIFYRTWAENIIWYITQHKDLDFSWNFIPGKSLFLLKTEHALLGVWELRGGTRPDKGCILEPDGPGFDSWLKPLTEWTWAVQLPFLNTALCVCVCMCAHSVVSDYLQPHELYIAHPGSSVHGILQTRILEWFAIFSSKGTSRSRDWTHVTCVSCIGRWSTTWEALQYWWPHLKTGKNISCAVELLCGLGNFDGNLANTLAAAKLSHFSRVRLCVTP